MDSKTKILLLLQKVSERTDVLGIEYLLEVLKELKKLEIKELCEKSKKI